MAGVEEGFSSRIHPKGNILHFGTLLNMSI